FRDTSVGREDLTEIAVSLGGLVVDDAEVEDLLLIAWDLETRSFLEEDETVGSIRKFVLHAHRGVRIVTDVFRHRVEVEGATIFFGERRTGCETVGVAERGTAEPVDVVSLEIVVSGHLVELVRIVARIIVAE